MNQIGRSLSNSRKLQVGLASLAIASIGGIAFAVPSSAQKSVECVRITFEVDKDGLQTGVESRVQAPPCPEGFVNSDDPNANVMPTTSPTTAAPETTAPPTTAAPETTAPPATEAPPTSDSSTTVTTVAPTSDVKEAPPAKPKPGDPNYTG